MRLFVLALQLTTACGRLGFDATARFDAAAVDARFSSDGAQGLDAMSSVEDAARLGDAVVSGTEDAGMGDAAAEALGSVGSGGYHSCAIQSSGAVACWGRNSFGQLGDGSTADRYTAADIATALSVRLVALGDEHTCVSTDGNVQCWGRGLEGQLGNGATVSQSRPVVAVDAVGTHLSLGTRHSCAVTSSGLFCWGENRFGQLGNGTTANANTPQPVTLAEPVVSIAAGDAHTCAVDRLGQVWCWGDNAVGQLGMPGGGQRSPVSVPGIGDAIAVGSGGEHVCVLRPDGRVTCWGRNDAGQLGDGTTGASGGSTDVIGLGTPVLALHLGYTFSCAVMTDRARCWGWNARGQFGDGTSISANPLPRDSGFGSGVVSFATGNSHTCALLAGLEVRCSGWNIYGQLGDGSTSDRTTPVPVLGLP